jgi:DNA-binding CsgD family transcriptional regulator
MNMASKRKTYDGGDPPEVPTPRVATFQLGTTQFAVLSVPLGDGSAMARLTAGEREVAALAATGLSNAGIARCRGTSERTVANQMASILRKLRVGSRYELAALLALSTLVKEES